MGPLVSFVLVETLRAVVTFGFVRSGIPLSGTGIICGSEAIKVLVAATILLRTGTPFFPLPAKLVREPETTSTSPLLQVLFACCVYAVPATLYLGNNMLYFVGLQLTTPGPLHVAMMARLPLTAALHHLIIRRQNDWRPWAALAALVGGLALTQAGAPEQHALDANDTSNLALLGSSIGLTIAAISAFASVVTERILKDAQSPFWRSQFWLYSWGLLFSLAGVLSWNGQVTVATPSTTSSSQRLVTLTATLLCSTLAAIVGLLAGSILRTLDTIWKLIGNALTMVTISVATAVLFPAMQGTSLTAPFISGSGTILLASWHYGWASRPVPVAEDGAKTPHLDAQARPRLDTPARPGFRYKPTIGRTMTCGGLILILSAVVSFSSY